ncbi:MAG: hypothetical protein ABL872_18070 [Lacibacter sp.]
MVTVFITNKIESNMQRFLMFFICAFLCVSAVLSQINPVISPAGNIPKLTIPVTISGKIKVVDSLKNANVNAGAILKAFIPQYTPQFQEQLVEQLIILRHAGFTSKETIPVVVAEYPNITKPVLYKIFFAYGHRINFAMHLLPWWPWDIEKNLNEAFGMNKNEPTAAKMLKDSKLNFETVFAYYARLMNEFTVPNCWKGLPGMSVEYIPENWQIKYNLYTFLQAGYSANEIYDAMKKNGYRSDIWLVGFCNANELVGTPVETIARILKADYIYGEELSRILKLTQGYNKPADILKALQAN